MLNEKRGKILRGPAWAHHIDGAMARKKKQDMDPIASANVAAGQLVRSLRRRRNMTLDQLAEEIGLSKGHLSRYERGEKSLSVSALMRLAKAMGTSVSTLLGEQDHAEFLHVVRAGERTLRKAARTDGNYEFAPLSRSGDARSNAFIIKLAPDSIISKDAYHSGEEMFFVLSGVVEIELATKSMLLRKGDFGQFPGHVRHRLRGLEKDTEILVMVIDLATA